MDIFVHVQKVLLDFNVKISKQIILLKEFYFLLEIFAALGFSYHYVIWPGVAILLLLVIILLTIVIGRIRESRRSQGTYRPALNENGQSSRVEFSMILKPPPEERLI